MKNEIKLAGLGILAFFGLIFLFSSFYIIQPGERGIAVTLGKVPSTFSREGLSFKTPFVSNLVRMNIQQQTQELKTQAFSSDLQTVTLTLKILYRIPEASVIQIYQQYAGNPFDSLIAPRVQEALKEVTATESAEGIAKKRETVKVKTLELSRKKIGEILFVEDVVIENLDLSTDLEKAIEQKMVQEQETAKARFMKDKAAVEAETAVIKADGEARAIHKRGEAIRLNPGVVDLMIAEKWNGVSPLVVGEGRGTNIVLPLEHSK